MAVYDVCIVGAGMIGSAAARHASLVPGLKVCLIGPSEPQERRASDERDIFGAFYDEARITRVGASDILWATVSAESAKRYHKLEQSTGIPFHTVTGCLHVGRRGEPFITNTIANMAQLSVATQIMPLKDMKAEFPYINTTLKNTYVLERNNCGHLNPRNLVRAEQQAAKSNGCEVMEGIVNSISDCSEIGGESGYKMTLDDGSKIQTKKVLLATGAFTTLRRLLPVNLNPDIQPLALTVILAELSEGDLAKMRNMPSIVHIAAWPTTVTDPPDAYCYILPPVKYPDGKHYIKLGHMDKYDKPISVGEMKAWYCDGIDEENRTYNWNMLRSLFPDFHPVSVRYDTCVIAKTPDKRPFVDLLTPTLGLALGGNGSAAKSCDELGRMAADLVITGRWNHSLPREWFRFKAKNASKM